VAPEDQPTEMDLILAAELGEAAERAGAGAAKPDGEKPARRRRTRGGRRRSAASEGEAGGEPAPVQSEIVYADIAELFEAAERAEAEQHMKTHLVVAPQTELELAADVHVPESVLEPVSHVIFEPAAEPWPAAPEPVAAEPAAAPEPAVKPVIIGAEPVLAEKKRGWWRR
jgi:hypothetical protein